MKYKDLGTMLSKEEMKKISGGIVPPEACHKHGEPCPNSLGECCAGHACIVWGDPAIKRCFQVIPA